VLLTQVVALKTLATQVAASKTVAAQLVQLAAQIAVSKLLLATTAAIQVAKSSVHVCWTCSSSARAKVAMKYAAMRSALADVVQLLLQPQLLLLLLPLRKLLQCHLLQLLIQVLTYKASAASFRLAHTFAKVNVAN